MTRKLYKSFGYKALQILVLTLYSLLLIPILLNYWDLKLYGAWIALYTFFNLIQVLELGHSVYVGNEFNKIIHTNIRKGKQILGSALRINIAIGFLQITIVFLLYITGFLSFFIDKDIDIKNVAIVLTILFLYRMSIGSFRGIIVKILNPHRFIYKAFQFSLIEKIIEFFILIIAAVANITLIELALLWFAVKFLYSLIVLCQIKRILPEYFPWWKYGSFTQGLLNLKKSTPYFASNFVDRLSNDGILLVVSALMGSTFLPLFSATRTIVNFGLKLSDFFLSPINPEMINLYAKNKKKKLLEIFKGYWFFTGVILMVGFGVSIIFIEQLFEIWTNNTLDFSLLLYSSLVIIFLVQNHGKVLYTFFTGINKTGVVLSTSIIRITLFFTVVLLFKEYGLQAILIALFLSEFCVASFWLPYNTFKIFDFTNKQKIFFYNNLIAVLFFAFLFYLNIYKNIVILMIICSMLVITLLWLQYQQISRETKTLLDDKFKKLTNFVKKDG